MPTSTPGKSASRRKPNRFFSDSGFTLIELLVALAIVGLIFAVAATGLRSVFSINLKSSAGKLAATLRYLSNKAVTDHLYIRVIYDLKGETYSVEECTEPVVVAVEEEEAEVKEEEKNEGGEEEGDKKKTSESSCVPSESSLLKPVKLPSGVLFKDVSLSYLKTKKEEGKAVTYFFPDGYATPTLINFKDDDDENHYSVEVEALSGKVLVTSEYQEHFSEWSKEEGS
jgi:prepilin-type N-terminal cleavage/methylation domain-containing protein